MVIVMLALALALAACGRQAPAPAAPSATPEGAFDGEWRLVSGTSPSGEIPVPRQVTLVVAGPEISGVSACNSYSATAAIEGSNLRVEGLGGTAMGCPGKRMVAEERYGEALQAADTIRRDGDLLTITGPDVQLQFEPVVAEPPAALEDTRWRLDSMASGSGNDGTVASTTGGAPPATLTLHADGRLSGDTGCVKLQGRWERQGDRLTFSGVPQGDFDCPEAGDQNEHMLKVLRTPVTARVAGQTLDLRQIDGELGLGFRAD